MKVATIVIDEPIDYGEIAFEAYRVYTDGLTYDKKPIPEWNALTAMVQGAWRAAAQAVQVASE